MQQIQVKNKLIKKVIILFLSLICTFLLIIVLYVAYQALHLEFWTNNRQTDVKELSKQDKIEDFEYLTNYVREVYPYNDAIVKYKSLDNICSLEKNYIERAGLTSNNTDFFKLVYEYTQRLRQGDGHIYIYFGSYKPQNNNFLQYYFNNIKKSAYFKTDYWGRKAKMLRWFAFSDIDVSYVNGKYVLNKGYKLSDKDLPKGTIIEKVDGMKTDNYVRTLQNKVRLLFDDKLHKNFTTKLFSIDSNTSFNDWNVDFKLKSGELYNGKLRKLNTDEYTVNSLSRYNYPNVVCRELGDDTGYIKIFTFNQEYIRNDNKVIQRFMNNSNSKYKKLIIDIRGNTGGEINYWGENIVRPLLKEPKCLVQYSAIRKGFFKRMGFRYYLFRWLTGNDLLQKDLNHIVSVEKTELKEFKDKDWDIFKIKKKFTPKNSFPFKGKVYILTDRDTFSAADSFAATVKSMKIGKLIGTNTGGSGNVFMAPVDICLPHSKIMLKMNVELTLNDKNQPNQIFGTSPDVELQSSSYPTVNPKSLEVSDLVEDPWINWVLMNK